MSYALISLAVIQPEVVTDAEILIRLDKDIENDVVHQLTTIRIVDLAIGLTNNVKLVQENKKEVFHSNSGNGLEHLPRLTGIAEYALEFAPVLLIRRDVERSARGGEGFIPGGFVQRLIGRNVQTDAAIEDLNTNNDLNEAALQSLVDTIAEVERILATFDPSRNSST